MSAIFISHSSKDNAAADVMRARLQGQAHRSVFLDFDPELGIPAGRHWEKELYTQLRGCRAVIVLCSEHSMTSQWCFAEIAYARALGKQLFPVKVAPCTITPLLADTEMIDLTADPDEAYLRLWSGLRIAGLDAASVFDWDGQRQPFPGLESFEENDAAVFFGRDNEVQQVIAALNHSRRLPDPRLFVIRGASGTGKSSLVRAGVLPRLRRDSEHWIVLEPFRPAETGGPFAGLARALAKALEETGRPRDWRDVRDLLHQSAEAQHEEQLADLALDLRTDHQSVLITIDQAEELLARDRAKTTHSFLRLLGHVTGMPSGPFFVMVTLRSDFLPEFEDHVEMRGKAHKGIHVPPLGVENLARIIEGPAEIAGIELEPGLVQAMVNEAGTSTALPILAFVLRQLWDRHGHTKRLTLQDYAELNGLQGVIGRAAEAVYEEAVNTEDQEQSLRKAFLSMVQVGEEEQFIRRPVKLAQLPHGVHEIVERFVSGRLLVKSSVEGGEPVVEVAHEAVLTSWPRLETWIKEVRGELRLLRQMRLAAADWEEQGEAEEFLWPDKRLVAVYEMIDRLEPELSEVERRFVGLVGGDDLLEELNDIATRHHRRAQIGDRLARGGDGRPGVGLGADGLPDIVWCDVPGGEISLEGSAEPFHVEPFQISKYPVTWAQYSAFLQAPDGSKNPFWSEGLAAHPDYAGVHRRRVDNHPAENVSWFDAVACCRWLSSRLSCEIRLPTEWEWQQAATGGDPANSYPWGAEWDSRRANTLESDLQRTTAVGMYPHGASPIGALDMSGNVYEWCVNEHEKPEQVGLAGSDKRAVRGGSWQWEAKEAGTAVRGPDVPDVRIPDHGFRVVRSSGDA
jgi:formylglycine-generating enzyme required for sulfatase activity